MSECEKNKTKLNGQQQHWNKMYSGEPNFFGEEPSYAAKQALEKFKTRNYKQILELGAGQGRDTLFFANHGLNVYALDYSEEGVKAINIKAKKTGLSEYINALCHDIRKPLPFVDKSFDALYCHMLYCMALCTSELTSIFQEVRRVLKPNGLTVYTVRHTGDSHYQQGIHRGENIYEAEGFTVHFFNKEKVKQLSQGYEIISIEEFEEGELPRKLFLVILRKSLLQQRPLSI